MALAQALAYPEVAKFFNVKKSDVPRAPNQAISLLADRGLPQTKGQGYKLAAIIECLSEQQSILELSPDQFDLDAATKMFIAAKKAADKEMQE